MVAPAVAFPVVAALVALSGLFSGLTLGLMGALRFGEAGCCGPVRVLFSRLGSRLLCSRGAPH